MKFVKFNYKNLCVIMGSSMKPFFSPGDIIKVEKFNKSLHLYKGKVVCFTYHNKSYVHRIIKINKKRETVVTRGDNLEFNDKIISFNQIDQAVISRLKNGREIIITKYEELFALLFSKYFFYLRIFLRNVIANIIGFMYPYIKVNKVLVKNKVGMVCNWVWRGKKIASLSFTNERKWIHPWFRKTPIAKRVGLNGRYFE